MGAGFGEKCKGRTSVGLLGSAEDLSEARESEFGNHGCDFPTTFSCLLTNTRRVPVLLVKRHKVKVRVLAAKYKGIVNTA